MPGIWAFPTTPTTHSPGVVFNASANVTAEKKTASSRDLSRIVSEASVEAAPFADVSAGKGGGSARALENVVLETCARRGDVAVSLGVSALDACFAAPPERRLFDTKNPKRREAFGGGVTAERLIEESPARLWTVFKREDAPLLARWLALRGSSLDEPCLAFETQREARETAAALAAAARAARALAEIDPGEAREAVAAEAAAEAARDAAERAARAAYDAASAVSPRQAASALRRRDDGAHREIEGLLQRQMAPLLKCTVAVHGVVARPELNGQQGEAVLFDEKSGRYGVKLPAESVKLLPKNLQRCD